MGGSCCRAYGIGAAIFLLAMECRGAVPNFHFQRDTLSFANSTVFEYENGKVVSKNNPKNDKSERYTRRCFVMSRTIVQFNKFARFDPRAAPLDDKELTKRVREITHMRPWEPPLPREKRIVFPGYANLRSMSHARARLMQKNIGLGWPTYARLGNGRMFYLHNVAYQEKTHNELNQALDRGEFFIVYLSDYPTLHINHAVTVYSRNKKISKDEDRYLVYDPNHPDGPRELKWSYTKRAFDFQKDEEFVGGFTRAYQIYGKPFQ